MKLKWKPEDIGGVKKLDIQSFKQSKKYNDNF